MAESIASNDEALRLTRIDITLSSVKITLSEAFAEATAAGNTILDKGWAEKNTIDVFFNHGNITHDTTIIRK